MLRLLALSLSLIALSAAAAPRDTVPAGTVTQDILHVTSDRNPDTSVLGLTLQGTQFVGIRFLTHAHDGEGHTIGGPLTRFFSADALASGSGVVLDGVPGHDALLLRGTVDSAAGTGSMTVRYLSNGLTGHYDECDVRMARDASGNWSTVNAYSGRSIRTARIITWALGIQTIQGICPK